MQSPDDFLKEKGPKQRFTVFDDEEDIYKFIVAETADREIRKIADQIQDDLGKGLTGLLRGALQERVEVGHIREEGLRIWGKADNVAFSKDTAIHLLSVFKSAMPSDAFSDALADAGERAALHFFDHFRTILTIDQNDYVPRSIVDFLSALGQFDRRSGWWDNIEFDDSTPGVLDIAITKPFWRFPFDDKLNHENTAFAAAYIYTLHNCCYDYMRSIYLMQGFAFESPIALSVTVFKDPDFEKSHLQLKRTDEVITEFDPITARFWVLAEWLLTDDSAKHHRAQIYEVLEELQALLGGLGVETNINAEQLRADQRMLTFESIRLELSNVIIEARMRFNKYRQQALRS